MKNLILLAVALACMSAGCTTKYATIENKDVSVKVRSIWADVDYDSRVCPGQLKELPELNNDGVIPALEPLE